MVRRVADFPPGQLGLAICVVPQNSGVVPQKPNLEQQTWNHQVLVFTL